MDLLESSQLDVSNYITHIMCPFYLLSFADFEPIFLLQVGGGFRPLRAPRTLRPAGCLEFG